MSMRNELHWLRAALPAGAEWVIPDQWPYGDSPVVATDVDGDGMPEWIGACRWQDDLYVVVFKWNGAQWVPVAAEKGKGDGIGAFYAAHTSDPYRADVIVGWARRDGRPRLSIYQWTEYGLTDIAPDWRELPADDGYRTDDADRETGEDRAIRLYPIPVKTTRGTLWGYIDKRGRTVLPPTYEYAMSFQDNGLAVVQQHGKQGVIDAKGDYVAKPVYDSISPFSEGVATVYDREGSKMMDDLGHILTPRAYDYIGTLKNGRAVFNRMDEAGHTRYGYLDRQGKEAIPARYEEAGDFEDGRAVVKIKDGEYALIGKNGQRLATYRQASVGPLSEGRMSFQREPNGKYGYIDEKGRVVIPPRFTAAMPFRDGRAVVDTAGQPDSRYGLIDKSGAFVIPAEYNDILPLGDQRVAIGQAIDPARAYIGSKYALATTGGRRLTGFDFYEMLPFDKGYSSVSDRNYTYFIDRNGKPAAGLPRLEGSGSLEFTGSLIGADVDQRRSYYDRSGKPVWKPDPTIPLEPPYLIREMKYRPNRDYVVYYPQIEGMADPAVERRTNEKLKRLSAVKPVPADKQLDADYTGDFDVVFYRDDLLVLELFAYNYPFGAAHGMPSREYVHLNLANGDMYALKDLFKPGAPFTKTLTDIVKKQIATNPEYSYVFPDSTVEVKPDQLFHVTEDALHILFPPYEIAPYAAGFPTFVIPFSQLADIVDTNGAFWKSFHRA
ncbi:WG repeat-containing protein [Paenibacillus flagellatus]|uniref:DUF3298 domain-containing protein n=1 Tax=Paenibacillus flagellatus TaxID=2211139 RepID=A0A2V5JXT7_9BACL|nr:WG repeat-containing protein [Paenibacillus flagellatus]PYI51511.1 hypothetical protein DLM86_24115 [Paenibacillus flagellatus]